MAVKVTPLESELKLLTPYFCFLLENFIVRVYSAYMLIINVFEYFSRKVKGIIIKRMLALGKRARAILINYLQFVIYRPIPVKMQTLLI